MDNLLSRAAVLALVAGGFAFTGDLGWIAGRGLRALDAVDVDPPTATAGTRPAGVGRPSGAVPPAPGRRPPSVDAGIPCGDSRPPAGGRDELAWDSLHPGDRVVVWLSGPGPRCLALDVVDPAAGEALAYEVATVSVDGRPLAAASPPCRVFVARQPGGLTKGGMLHLAPAGLAAAGSGARRLGPIEALIEAR